MTAESAFVRVRVFPWRVRPRVMKPSTLRDGFEPLMAFDDLSGIVIGIGLWIVVLVAAPVLVFVLAGLLLPFEVSLLALLAVLIVVARLAGIAPWVISIVNNATGEPLLRCTGITPPPPDPTLRANERICCPDN